MATNCWPRVSQWQGSANGGWSLVLLGVGQNWQVLEPKRNSLGLQIPSKKLLKLLKTPQSIFLEGLEPGLKRCSSLHLSGCQKIQGALGCGESGSKCLKSYLSGTPKQAPSLVFIWAHYQGFPKENWDLLKNPRKK